MKKVALYTFLLLCLPLSVWAGDDDDFGAWVELGLKKNLPNNWSVGLEGEFRTKDGSHVVDRWSFGANVNYRAHKYLKLDAGYSFMSDYNADKTTKIKFDSDGELESYRYTPSYWSPRHRAYFAASSGVKLWKWFRISGKLKYQYTYTPSLTVMREDHELYDQVKPEGVVKIDDVESNPKHYEGSGRQVLRSRIKFEVDKKRLDWSPFVAVEFHNDLAADMHFDKLRTSIGTGYKIDKQNDLSLSYMLTLDRQTAPVDLFHAICIGYSYEF